MTPADRFARALVAVLDGDEAEPWDVAAARRHDENRRKRERAKRSVQAERHLTLTEIIAAVDRRASWCENPECVTLWSSQTPYVHDHWLGGSGRRRQHESVETVWKLCFWCNRDRTDNVPDSATWNRRFELHCTRYGYPFIPHIVQ